MRRFLLLFNAVLALLSLAFPARAAAPNAPPDPAEATRQIDALLAADWEKHGLKPNPPASEEVFLRRVYLDIVGRIPAPGETQEFLADRQPDKRTRLIDKLLASDGYSHRMFTFWADVLRAQTAGLPTSGISSALYLKYLKESIRANKPYDQFVRELVSSDGKIWENGAVGYYMRDRGMPLDNMANTARIFLGTRMECAQCHDHPFDKWTQMQFYQMAAFTYGMDTTFTGIREAPRAIALFASSRKDREARMKSPDPAVRAQAERETKAARWSGAVFENLGDRVKYVKTDYAAGRELRLPHDYQYSDAQPKSAVKPATVLGVPAEIDDPEALPEAYARWLTSPENPRFTSVIANRLWKLAFGRALIEPLDDLKDDSEAVNPELMKYLEKLMVDLRYDLKAFQRVIYNTSTYQASASREQPEAGTVYRFTGPLLRRMTAEQLWDSLVALINPAPDEPRELPGDRDMAIKVGQLRKISDALDLLTAQELFEGALKAGETYEATAARSSELKDAYTAAQKAKDKAEMERLNLEIRAQSMKGRSAANDLLVVPAVARLYTQVTGRPAPPAPRMTEAEALAMMKRGKGKQAVRHNYIAVPGYDVPEESAAEREQRMKAQRARFDEEARLFGLEGNRVDEYAKAREKIEATWLRASELSSPAPRGHFLRDFGQSDRQVIENANDQASVPQALVLMNGDLLPALTQRHSQIMLAVEKAKKPEEKLVAVYLALLTRLPNEKEKASWEAARAKGLDSTEDVIFAVINTQQFLFIQ
jgi:hypothetical protein